MSVSRVEYDAALKRVKRRATHRPCSVVPCGEAPPCYCTRVTLAALGLDEPPTETTGDDAHLRPEDRVCRHDDGPRRWTLPFCNSCGKLGRRTPESPVCACGALTYSEAQVVERAHLSRAERECDEARAAAAPPAEPPKACPTCGGTGVPLGSIGPCLTCHGSGIDGGTAGGADV